jgi:membrane protein DedA with SNARE-associated domain
MNLPQLIETIENIYIQWGSLLVFISSFIEITPIGFAIPGGTIIFLGGFLSFEGNVEFASILISAWLGAWSTFLLAYALGNKIGNKLVSKLHQEKNAKIAETLLMKHGGAIITTSLVANLIRFWVSFVAGERNYSFKKFFIYSSVAALSWSAILTTLGYIVGMERANLEDAVSRLGIIAWVLLAIAVGVIYWAFKKEFKKNPKEGI